MESVFRHLVPGETVVEDLGYWNTDDKGTPHFVPIFCVETNAGAQSFSAYVSRETYHRWLHADEGEEDLGLPLEYLNPDALRRHLMRQTVAGVIQTRTAAAELWRLRGPGARVNTEAELLSAITTLVQKKVSVTDIPQAMWNVLADYLDFAPEVLH